MQTISRATMDEVIDANKYLQLPRLSSQLFFNQLCPQSSDAHTRRQVLIQCFTAGISVCIICGRNSETEIAQLLSGNSIWAYPLKLSH